MDVSGSGLDFSMAISSKLRVMISSRCNDAFPLKGGAPLSSVRKDLKQEIEAAEMFGRKIFEVWINEDQPPQPGSEDSWDVCLAAIRDCDILLVLSNGNAGWTKSGGEIGICHAELMTGLSVASGKVWLISLGNIPLAKGADRERNERFQDYVQQQSLFRGGEVKDVSALKIRVREALADALVKLSQRGVREAAKGKYNTGQALDWTRLDFLGRQKEILTTARRAILQRAKSRMKNNNVVARIASEEVLLILNALPGPFGVAAAREMVGQPFLRDYEFANELQGNVGGPVHIICCHQNVTEAQARRVLGFPDATFVNAPSGAYVVDNIHNIQLAYANNCRDEANTMHSIQRLFEWLEQSGESQELARRAQSRARIVKAIAKEN